MRRAPRTSNKNTPLSNFYIREMYNFVHLRQNPFNIAVKIEKTKEKVHAMHASCFLRKYQLLLDMYHHTNTIIVHKPHNKFLKIIR